MVVGSSWKLLLVQNGENEWILLLTSDFKHTETVDTLEGAASSTALKYDQNMFFGTHGSQQKKK